MIAHGFAALLPAPMVDQSELTASATVAESHSLSTPTSTSNGFDFVDAFRALQWVISLGSATAKATGSRCSNFPPSMLVRSMSKTFTAVLFRYPGKGGWTFVEVPQRLAPPATHSWGRTPVVAVIDGTEVRTSVWRSKSGQTLLPVAKKVRGTKEAGMTVKVKLSLPVIVWEA